MDDEAKQSHLDHGADDERRHTRIMSEFGEEGTDRLLRDMAETRLVDEDRIDAITHSGHHRDEQEYALTEIELEILQLLSHGLSLRGVAEMRVVSIETIKTQMKPARDKLRAKNTVQAVAIAVGRGLIPSPESGDTPHRKIERRP